MKVAHQLIEALAGDFEPEKYHDTFEENVKTLIKARLEGEEVTPVEKPKKMAPVVDLMARSKESLAQLPKKPPQRVEAAERASEVKAVAKGKKSSRKKPAASKSNGRPLSRPSCRYAFGRSLRQCAALLPLTVAIRRAQDMRLRRQHHVVEA